MCYKKAAKWPSKCVLVWSCIFNWRLICRYQQVNLSMHLAAEPPHTLQQSCKGHLETGQSLVLKALKVGHIETADILMMSSAPRLLTVRAVQRSHVIMGIPTKQEHLAWNNCNARPQPFLWKVSRWLSRAKGCSVNFRIQVCWRSIGPWLQIKHSLSHHGPVLSAFTQQWQGKPVLVPRGGKFRNRIWKELDEMEEIWNLAGCQCLTLRDANE